MDSPSRRSSLMLVALMTMMVFTHSAGATITPDANDSVIDSALILAMDSDPKKEHPVIIQFSVEVDSQIRAFLIGIGVSFEHQSDLLNGGLAQMNSNQIAHLSHHPEIRFLELDRPLQTFYLDEPIRTPDHIMMHETTHVTNATTAWSRAIIQRDGSVKLTDTGAFAEWDGDGTTAVDLDTGVDAEHPDFDYAGPWNGDKVIYSAKLDPAGWTETKNSDTSSGHGTHVGGTIAGNGDVSGGRRLGTAKGAQLVALGAGDLVSIYGGVQGLEWVYEHSRPGNNQNNIRVVSNSWGTDGDYAPQNAITKLTDSLTFDNGVAVIFAASNSGGSGSEGDSDLRTNIYANTPSAISIAALTHDGTAVTSFSSRGWMSQQHTWPDLGAPGRDIWATAPRRTAIDASTRTQGDLYYMAISGTSMATPHIGGIATLLIDAAPSLGVADYHREDHDEGISLVTGSESQGLQMEDWDTANETRIHEVELIMELTSKYIPNSCEDGNDEDSCNDVPTNESCYLSRTGQCHDWRVGHGLVDVDAALGLARTLELMRDTDGDGFVDDNRPTVWDAYEQYQNIMKTVEIPLSTDRLVHTWKGEWSHFNNGPSGTFGTYSTDDRHYTYIPNGTTRLDVVFEVVQRTLENGDIGQHSLTIDIGENGENDAGTGNRNGDVVSYSIDIDESQWNQFAEFDVIGNGITLIPITSIDDEFYEPLFAYTVSASLTIDVSSPVVVEVIQRPDGYTDLDPTTPSEMYDPANSGNLKMIRGVYDESEISLYEETILSETESSIFLYLFITILVIFTSGATALFVTRYANPSDDDFDYIDSNDLEAEGAVLEADLVSVGALSAGDD
ncbi:MAG: hypothetical protein CMB31_02630 [Euryarchaeota archaeon]|nr:hypothetical protein [Euryarchaeota archaeon]